MRRKLSIALVVVTVLCLAVATPLAAQTIWQTYGNVRAKALNVLGTTDLDRTLNVDGAATLASLNVTGNGTVVGTLTSTGAVIASTKLNLVPQAILTVTDGGTITPTGTLQLLTAAGAVGADIASGSSGQVLVLLNTAAQTITITDTTGFLLSGNIALAQWDTATLVFYGTSWIQVAESDN